jgi:tetratricopeptide (TPR) repeat protein
MRFSRNQFFVGRIENLLTLARMFRSGGVPVVSLTGLGGTGKTQLACEFVHRYGQFFEGGVFWLSFADPNAVTTEVAACGGKGYLNLGPGFAKFALDDKVRVVMEAWHNELPRLLVFDNCESEALLGEWRPKYGGCRILVTSQYTSWDASLGVERLPVGTLTRAESISLLQKYRPDLDANNAILGNIASYVGDLPLALHLAGSYLKRYQADIQPISYMEELESSPALNHESFIGETSSPTGHDPNIEKTFMLTYNQLDGANRIDSLALQLLARAVYFAPGELIPRDLLKATLEISDDAHTVRERAKALGRLTDLGLLETEAAGRVRLHQLLVIFVKTVMSDKRAQSAVEQTVLIEARRLSDTTDPLNILSLQPHMRAVTEGARQRVDEQAAYLCNEFGFHLDLVGDFQGARQYFEYALAISRQVHGEIHPDTAWILTNFGIHLRKVGNLQTAQNYFQDALGIYEQVLHVDQADIAWTLNNLGFLLSIQGKYSTALPYLKRALSIYEEISDGQDRDIANVLNDLGTLHRNQGDLEQARQYLERALAIREQILGPEHLETALSLNNLGFLLYQQNDFGAARPYLERALAVRERVLGELHPDTATSLNDLGMLFQQLGDPEQARQYLERALAIREQILGPEHLETVLSLNNLGFLLYQQNDFGAARPYLEHALAVREQALGEFHLDVATSLNDLGKLERDQGNLKKALLYLERALAIREQILGPAHIKTARILSHLATVHRAQGQFQTAITLVHQALDIHIDVLGSQNPKTQAVRDNLTIIEEHIATDKLNDVQEIDGKSKTV